MSVRNQNRGSRRSSGTWLKWPSDSCAQFWTNAEWRGWRKCVKTNAWTVTTWAPCPTPACPMILSLSPSLSLTSFVGSSLVGGQILDDLLFLESHTSMTLCCEELRHVTSEVGQQSKRERNREKVEEREDRGRKKKICVCVWNTYLECSLWKCMPGYRLVTSTPEVAENIIIVVIIVIIITTISGGRLWTSQGALQMTEGAKDYVTSK